MISNSSDKALLKAFKNIKDRAAFDTALSKLRTGQAQSAFRSLHGLLSNPSEATVPLEHIEALLTLRLIEAAEFIFGKMEQRIASLGMDDVLRIAPTSRCLQSWVSVGSKKGTTESNDRSAMLIGRFKQSPATSLHSALAHWFVSYAPMLHDSLPIFTAKNQGREFTSIENILGAALRRDKDGQFISRLLTQPGDAASHVLALVRNDSTLFNEFARTFTLALKELPTEVIQTAVRGLIGDIKLGKKLHGRELSRRLLSLAAAALEVKANEQVDSMLAELDRLSAELQNTVPQGEVDKDFSGIRYHGRQRQASTEIISVDVAKHLAITISKIRGETDPILALEATAFNLGMRGIQKVGETIAFDPSIHEDVIGGALRGDTVTVFQTGWCLGDQLIERAKVQRSF